MTDTPQQHRLIAVDLDETLAGQLSAQMARERDIAIFALLEDNSFAFAPGALASTRAPCRDGPFRLRLSVADNRLLMQISDQAGAACHTVTLPLTPFRRVLRDYKRVCQGYFEAIKSSPPQRIEAIDMGRRGLHDEGSHLLIEALKNKITLDFETARRLFTLLFVLQLQGKPAAPL